jgi:hypothetical protein
MPNTNHRRLTARLTLAAAVAAVTSVALGCEGSPDAPYEEIDTVEVTETAESGIRGFSLRDPLRGLVKVTVTGQADTHTGLQLGPDVVVTSNRWIGHATAPANVRVAAMPGTAGAQSTLAAGVNASDFFPAAIVHHADFAANNTQAYPTAVSHAVEQRTCTGSADQRWFPRWVP